ncbi:MAG TPA: hypothetical protein VK101_01290 [Limnochordia bacterium]|nr:hypothetical protein [Limnochordia bacterium]
MARIDRSSAPGALGFDVWRGIPTELDDAVTNRGAMFAIAVLSLAPVSLIFVTFQRRLMEGISTTGLKG